MVYTIMNSHHVDHGTSINNDLI